MEIDNLSYSYDTNKQNQLLKVEDSSINPNGFKDGINTDDDYTYDDNGNMLTDQNKGITAIHYNHLNLPVQIVFGTLGQIDYIYNAVGEKLFKKVYGNSIPTAAATRYRDGFQYKGDLLDFFPHAEGYVTKIDNVYKYVFNYTDHLGNVRLSYGYDPGDDEVKILEENNYYPFGMKHQNYNWNHRFYLGVENGEIEIRLSPPLSHKYKYNGKEFQDELGLNMYAMDMRQYDPAIGRWVVQDPIVHHSMSPYNGFDNNPVFWADPSGGNVNDMMGADVYGNNRYTNEGMFIPLNERENNNPSGCNSEDESDEEPPVNLFMPTSKNPSQKTFNDVFNEANKPENYEIGDMVFTVYGHGSEVHIGDNKHVPDLDYVNAKQFDTMMKDRSPAYKKVEKLTEFKLTLYTCQSATGKNPMAKQISKAHPNATVIGFDGFVGYDTTTVKPSISRVSVNADMSDKKGYMVTYKNGIEVNRVLYSQYLQNKK